jgi:type IV secretory pathway TraG/TraD family ATPase VirD4
MFEDPSGPRNLGLDRLTAPGDMLIFVSGHHPIHETQILYFSDPVLSKRAAIAVAKRLTSSREHASPVAGLLPKGCPTRNRAEGRARALLLFA